MQLCNSRHTMNRAMFEHKLVDIQQRLQKPIAKATGLPNERYINTAAFADDRDFVTGPGWSCIAFVEDLPEQNYVLPIDFMGVPLVVTRDNNNELRVFHNVCSHRGMHLATEPCQTKGMLRCPYHSWTYKMNGDLRGTPHVGGYGVHEHPEFDRGANGLKEVRSAIWLNAVFINLTGGAIDFEAYVEPLTRQFNELCDPSDRLLFKSSNNDCRTSMTVKSNWKLPVENYLESYHLPTVHPELNKTSPLDVHFDLDRFDNGGGQGSTNYTRADINDMTLPVLPGWSAAKQNLAVYPVLYPNTFIGLHSDHLFIMFLQPTTHDGTIEHVRISYAGEEALDDTYQLHRAKLLADWTNVFKEDIFAVERMHKGRYSPGYQGGAFSPVMDSATVHFHQWVANQLVKNTTDQHHKGS